MIGPRLVALAGLAAFVAITMAEHALTPQLDPDRHTISEYVNADAGGLMVAAFVAWGLSLLATAALAWGNAGAARGHRWIAASLGIAGVGLLLTAAFATQTSAGILPPGVQRTTGGRIHDLASLAAMVAMFGGVIASAVVLRARQIFARFAVGAIAIAVVASAVLLSIGDPVDGIRQRVLVAIGCTWQAALIAALTHDRSS